jgi:hypothetical protein
VLIFHILNTIFKTSSFLVMCNKVSTFKLRFLRIFYDGLHFHTKWLGKLGRYLQVRAWHYKRLFSFIYDWIVVNAVLEPFVISFFY